MPLVDIQTPVTSGSVVIPARLAQSDNTTTPLVLVRNAAGDWSLNRTAVGAETFNIMIPVWPNLTETTSGKGIRIDSLGISQLITGQALTSAAFTGLKVVQYANNVANSVANLGGSATVTMPTAIQANPYLTPVTFSVPAFQNLADCVVLVEFQIVMQNGGSYRFNGLAVEYSLELY